MVGRGCEEFELADKMMDCGDAPALSEKVPRTRCQNEEREDDNHAGSGELGLRNAVLSLSRSHRWSHPGIETQRRNGFSTSPGIQDLPATFHPLSLMICCAWLA